MATRCSLYKICQVYANEEIQHCHILLCSPSSCLLFDRRQLTLSFVRRISSMSSVASAVLRQAGLAWTQGCRHSPAAIAALACSCFTILHLWPGPSGKRCSSSMSTRTSTAINQEYRAEHNTGPSASCLGPESIAQLAVANPSQDSQGAVASMALSMNSTCIASCMAASVRATRNLVLVRSLPETCTHGGQKNLGSRCWNGSRETSRADSSCPRRLMPSQEIHGAGGAPFEGFTGVTTGYWPFALLHFGSSGGNVLCGKL